MVQTTRDGLTQAGFLSKWAYFTGANPRAALTHMLYLGVQLNADAMQRHFSTSRPRHVERKKARDSHCRTFFQVSRSCRRMLHTAGSWAEQGIAQHRGFA